jgi:hypothetical protein
MHTSSKVLVFRLTNELRQVLGGPALVGSERLDDYDRLFSSVELAIKPTEIIGWLLTKDVTDWSWEMRRERMIKVEIVKHYQKQVVAELIKSALAPAGQFSTALYRTFQAATDFEAWVTDPQVRAKIDEALAAKGHDVPSILAQAYMRGADQIDTIDRRIAAYERRRNTALREAGLWSDRLAGKLDKATEVIEGEFTEAAE